MKRIAQQDEYGCGISCVATLLDISYAAARKLLFADANVEPTQIGQLKKVLEAYGVACGKRLVPLGVRELNELQFDAIVKVNPRKEGEEWHWVVWDHKRGAVIDSKVPPYKRLKPVSYLKVERPWAADTSTIPSKRYQATHDSVERRDADGEAIAGRSIIGPDRYWLTNTDGGYSVRCETGAREFTGRSAKAGFKLYVVAHEGVPIYVGHTRQRMKQRLNYGWRAKGERGYYGYPWRHALPEVEMSVWHFDLPPDRARIDVETIEAEVVFLLRSAGQWPLHQTEIHFHPSSDWHRSIARSIVGAFPGAQMSLAA